MINFSTSHPNLHLKLNVKYTKIKILASRFSIRFLLLSLMACNRKIQVLLLIPALVSEHVNVETTSNKRNTMEEINSFASVERIENEGEREKYDSTCSKGAKQSGIISVHKLIMFEFITRFLTIGNKLKNNKKKEDFLKRNRV